MSDHITSKHNGHAQFFDVARVNFRNVTRDTGDGPGGRMADYFDDGEQDLPTAATAPTPGTMPMPQPAPAPTFDLYEVNGQEVDKETYDRATEVTGHLEDATQEYMPFPLHLLPPTVRQFVEYGITVGKRPDAFYALPTLAMLGAAVGTARYARLAPKYHEYPVIWAAVVADSGAGKSPAFDYVLEQLTKEQSDAVEAHRLLLKEHEMKAAQYKAAAAAFKKDPELAEPTPPAKPACRRYLATGTTVEALMPVLQENPRGVLNFRDELGGWFKDQNAYKGGKGSDEENWRQFWQAGYASVDRKTDREYTVVPKAAVSLTGGIQPAALARVIFQANADVVDGGTLPRFLLAMPPRNLPTWEEVEDVPTQDATMRDLLRHLLALHDGDANRHGSPVNLSPAAKALWRPYFNDNQARVKALAGTMQGYSLSKLERYVPRFALIFHLCNTAAAHKAMAHHPGELTGQEMADAIELARWFEQEHQRVYARLHLEAASQFERRHADPAAEREAGVFKQRQGRDAVLAMLRHQGTVTTREVMRYGGRAIKNKHQAQCLLHQLEREGHGMVHAVANPNKTVTHVLRAQP